MEKLNTMMPPFTYGVSVSQDWNKASAELLLLSILTFLQEKFTRGSFFIKIIDQQIAILRSKIQLQIFSEVLWKHGVAASTFKQTVKYQLELEWGSRKHL